MFMNLNFFLMNGSSVGASGVDLAFIVGEALLLVYAGRQALSLDGVLAQRGLSARFMSA